ncbi:galactokinase-like isoform X2 [Phymastichus coffea]|uniref:galactokinase-like isoform X2 n=1 Tax=Phymastichus coffea TaxID=108790 RepID=UPI00273B62D6|nr:galactokinase-like isoform X2 [Phymastichus coffea]
MATAHLDVNELKKQALQHFTKEFGDNATLCACAPGRVNLIGEHTDYNEGFVLPMALPLITVIVGKANNTKTCKIISMNTCAGAQNTAEFECINRQSIKPGEPKWANYIKGTIVNFPKDVSAFNAVIVSTVPAGGGLSSSAALEVATYTFLECLTGHVPAKLEDKALACQRAEHDFAGVPCGIMDQFISALALEGHALLLDCRDLATKHIPIKGFDNHVFLITNSNTPHKLSSSTYRQRRDCCHEATKLLGKKSLREAAISDLEASSLENNDFVRFGQLMNESHNSLRDDYEVSSEELDCLVSIARSVDGVLGTRLTGAGFGGCTVTLLKKDAVDNVIKQIKEKYAGTPSFYIAKPSSGARRLEL